MSPPQSLLCSGNVGNLRLQLARCTTRDRRSLEHVLWIARHADQFPQYKIENLHVVPEGLVRPMVRPNEDAYCFLAYLLTGETGFAEQARRKLIEVAESVSERERSDWTQMHCWCDAFPFARWVLLSDWIWDSGVLSDADRSRLEERFLYYAWAHPFQRLRARPIELTPCNNQNGAMAFACAVAGYLFGKKRGKSPLARKLLELGVPHLLKFLTAFPRGGYSYEGSTYMAGVNAFLIPLGLDVVEAITGEDLFDRRDNEECASPREVLTSMVRLCSPSGLLHPWDNYGYSRAEFTVAAAYLAFRGGDHSALRLLESWGAFEQPSHTGWGFDKTLWTWLYKLRAGNATEKTVSAVRPFGWAEPNLGTAAAGPSGRAFVFQMWDKSHWPPSRAQFNPNSLILEFDGAPLLLDGLCVETAKAAKFERPEYRFFRSDIQKEANIGIGTVGTHNTIVFDDEDHYAAPGTSEGKLVSAHHAKDEALFEGDVTDCYRHRYDVESVRRATLLLGDDVILVRDRIVSRTPHKITWCAHVRDGEARASENHFVVRTPDQVQLEICALDPERTRHQHFAGTAPSQLEGRCHEVSFDFHGSDLTLYTMLVPTALTQPWFDLDGGWEFIVAKDESEVASLLQSWPGGDPIQFDDASWFYTTGHHEPGIGIFRSEFRTNKSPSGQVWIRLPRLIRSSRVRVNGCEFRLDLQREEQPLLPHLLEVGAAICAGKNTLELIVPSTLESSLRGRVQLLIPASIPAEAKLCRRKDGVLELHHHGRCDRVTWNDAECRIERENGTAIQIQLEVRSDAVRRSTVRQACPPATPHGVTTNRRSLARVEHREETLRRIRSTDWRVVLEALEDVEGTTDVEIVQAAFLILQNEVNSHATLPARLPDDVCWYRLKAAAARVLGAARYEPATELLGKILLGPDMYPARVACAWALGQIETPQARDHLKRVPGHDEANTVLEAGHWL